MLSLKELLETVIEDAEELVLVTSQKSKRRNQILAKPPDTIVICVSLTVKYFNFS